MTTRRRPLASLVGALVVVLATAGPAAAHAEPTIVAPEACSSVASADAVRVTTSEELDANGTRLDLVVDGGVVASAGIDLDDLDHRSIVIEVPPGVTGAVLVQGTLASASDGDTVDVSWGFGLGADAPADCVLTVDDRDGSSAMGTVLVVATSAVLLVALAAVGLRSRTREAV